MKKIVYVTGSRSDYELMKHLLDELKGYFDVRIIVTGMHLLPEYGSTIKEVRAMFNIAKIIPENELLEGLKEYFTNIKPSALIVEGDRPEALISSTAAIMTGTKIIHLSGGDISGNRDNKIRYAITALADYHLPGTITSANRLLRLVENNKIFVTGHLMNRDLVSKEELDKKVGFEVDKDTVIVIQHPVTGEEMLAGEEMYETLLACIMAFTSIVIIMPNNDPGSEGIIRTINVFKKLYPRNIKVFKNLPGEYYNALMKYSGLMVGNSSSGITEAINWKLRVVNVGNRQEGREQGNNIINAPYNHVRIICAINKAKKLKITKNPYNTKGSTEKATRIIREVISL